MRGLLVALAMGGAAVACQEAPGLPPRDVMTVGAPGWRIDLPLDLRLEPFGPDANETAGGWARLDDSGLASSVIVVLVPNAEVPLEWYEDSLRKRPGAPLERLEPVAMPVGRAILASHPIDDALDGHTVIAELRPGLIVSIGTIGLTADDTVAIARSFRESPP